MALDLSLAHYAWSTRWVPLSKGGRVEIRRWNSPAVRHLQTRLYQEYRRARPGKPRITGKIVPPEVIEAVQLDLVVGAVLTNWDEFADGRTEVLYSEENARALLTQERYRWILEEIVDASQEADEDVEAEQEEDRKNSVTSLPGD